jgi:hypothetical protein
VQYLRLALTIILIPVYFIISVFVSSLFTKFTGLWDYYFIAFTLPVIGLMSTWLISPYYKSISVLGILITGIVLAFATVFPASYPENHALAYMPTYVPFIITVTTAILITVLICVYEYKKQKKL